MANTKTTLPAIPDIPESVDAGTRAFMEAVKETLEVVCGNAKRGNILDRFVTARELENAGIDSLAFNTGPDLVYNLSDYSTTGTGHDAPGIPTNFTIVNQVYANKLTWTNPPDDDFDHVEVWVSTTNDRSAAYVCGLVAGDPSKSVQFVHSAVSTLSNYYYWIRAVDRGGNKSSFNPTAADAGEEVLANTRATINELLEELTDESRYINTYQIISDAFMVSQPIDTFDAWETGTVYAEDDYVQNDSAAYICTQGHTSGAASEPGIGGSWTTYWDLIDSDVYDGTGINVFTIGNIDGNPTIGIRGDLFVDGTIIARMVATDAIEADHIKAGAVVLSEASGSLDDISDGPTYVKIKSTSVLAGEILLTETVGYSSLASLSLVNSANCTITGNSVEKTGGSDDAWDASVYSYDGYTGGAFCSFRAGQTNGRVTAGLNTDPTTDDSWDSIDFAWYLNQNGKCHIYESGVLVYNNGDTYTTTTVLAIKYDGVNLTYWKDGVLLYTSLNSSTDLKLFFDTSFYDSNAILNNIQFGPLSDLGNQTLDNIANGTYGKVLTTDISAGHILLSECTGDLDDIANGTYGKVLSTDISSGKIVLVGSTASININNTTFGNAGIQLQYNSGSPRIYVGDGSNEYIKYITGTGISISTAVSSGITIKSGGGIVVESGGDINIYSGVTDAKMVFHPSSGSNNFEIYATDYVVGSTYQRLYIKPDHASSESEMWIGDATDKVNDLYLYLINSLHIYTQSNHWWFTGSTFDPSSHKVCDIATAVSALDNMYSDDFNNVADLPMFDEYDDLEIIHGFKKSGIKDERTGFALIDDNSIPEVFFVKYKEDTYDGDGKLIGKKGQTARDPDGKPYLSLKVLGMLAIGGIDKLDNKFEQHLREHHS